MRKPKKMMRALAACAITAMTLSLPGMAFADEVVPPEDASTISEVASSSVDEAPTPAEASEPAPVPNPEPKTEPVIETPVVEEAPAPEPIAETPAAPVEPDPAPAVESTPDEPVEVVNESEAVPSTQGEATNDAITSEEPVNSEPPNGDPEEESPAPEDDLISQCGFFVSLPGKPTMVPGKNLIQIPFEEQPEGMAFSDLRGGDLAPGTVMSLTANVQERTVEARLFWTDTRYCWEDWQNVERYGKVLETPWETLLFTFRYDPSLEGSTTIDIPAQPDTINDDPRVDGDAEWNVPESTETEKWEVDAEGNLIVTTLVPNTVYPGGSTSHNYGPAPDVYEPLPPALIEPVEPERDGNTVTIPELPNQYYTVGGERVTEPVSVTEEHTLGNPLIICANVMDPETETFADGSVFCYEYVYLPPLVTCPEGMVPGNWLDEYGWPKGCVDDDSVTPSPEPEPTHDPEPTPTKEVKIEVILTPNNTTHHKPHKGKSVHSKSSSDASQDGLAETGADTTGALALSGAGILMGASLLLAKRRRSSLQ